MDPAVEVLEGPVDLEERLSSLETAFVKDVKRLEKAEAQRTLGFEVFLKDAT